MIHIDPKRDGLYQQETKVVAEGVRICKRADHKSGHWQAHITVPGQKVPYRKSTKTSDENEAAKRALAFKIEVEVKLRNDLPLTNRRIAQVAESFIEHLTKEQARGHMEADRASFLVGTLRRYVIPYFGKMNVASITEREIERYREWRKDNGKGTKGGTRTVPKPNTIRFEESALRQMLEHAVTMGVIDRARVPAIKSPKNPSGVRPGFTRDQWKKLKDAMDANVAAAEHPHVKRKRQLLRAYVRFMVATGLRVGEARYLRWCDIEEFTTKNGKKTVQLAVTGKTKKRNVMAQPVARLILDDLKALLRPTTPEQYVFTLNGVDPIETFSVGFTELLKKTNLLLDLDGTKRTVYSLRHTYATFRREAHVDVGWLSKNMGTSVRHIETTYDKSTIFANADEGIKNRKRRPGLVGISHTMEDDDD